MEYRVLGWPPEGPTLRLDHRRFAYAGKFVMSTTGKAVAVPDGAPDPPNAREGYADVVAAAAFNDDRTDGALWIRYVTVRADERGRGVGARLCAVVARAARNRGYERLRIAVNNVFAYHALHKAGFGFTGRETGLAELVLERPGPTERYREGLAAFAERDLSDAEERFLKRQREDGPPERIETPGEADGGGCGDDGDAHAGEADRDSDDCGADDSRGDSGD